MTLDHIWNIEDFIWFCGWISNLPERRRQELQGTDEEIETRQSANYFCKNLKKIARKVEMIFHG